MMLLPTDRVTFMPPPDGRYGVPQSDGNWSGLMGMLVRNEADISPGPFLMTTERVRAANPTFPWAYEDMVIFAGRPLRFAKNVFGFLKAFSGPVWAATARAEHLPDATLPRALVTVWFLGIIVLRTSFLGEMKAALVVRADVTSIRGMEDVAKDDRVTPIVLRSSGFYTVLKGEAVMIFVESPVAAMVDSRCERLGPLDAEFYYAPRPVTQLPMAMFMRKALDPALQNAVGAMIEVMIERGFLAKFYRDSRLERPPCRQQTAMGQKRANASSQMDSLQGVFLAWLAGLLCATAALIFEGAWQQHFERTNARH
ncbi:glutamate receptor ionotropic, delta-2-like [Haemaphysalis longicornis]